jgi:FdrA protein
LTELVTEVRRGAYFDSLVLMQLERALAGRPGVLAAGVVMGTAANRPLLVDAGLLTPEAEAAAPDDLVVVLKVDDRAAAESALAGLDAQLARRGGEAAGEGFRPRSLASAVRALPAARWVAVSVPGRWAAGVAREALALGRNDFLYSDNVPAADEADLKRRAAEAGLLVLGPDCGTAMVGGVGLGFANRVRRGAVGLVAASGTGLQAVACRLHALGAGVSHALGTGGRDLSERVGGATARQALDLLARDPRTRVIVLISKPPAPAVAERLLAAARATGKPVVVDLLGRPPEVRRDGDLHFARSLSDAAEIAAALAERPAGEEEEEEKELGGKQAGASLTGRATREPEGRSDSATAMPDPPTAPYPASGSGPGAVEDSGSAPRRRWLRGLFGGGTLALEAALALREAAQGLAANLALPGVEPLADPRTNRGHTIVDLGADELTVGRPHPMIDPRALAERLRAEAADPEVAVVLLDVVLGDGAHPDPAAELAPAIAAARAAGVPAAIVALVGTDLDPQGLDEQVERLQEAGARVFLDPDAAFAAAAAELAGETGSRTAARLRGDADLRVGQDRGAGHRQSSSSSTPGSSPSSGLPHAGPAAASPFRPAPPSALPSSSVAGRPTSDDEPVAEKGIAASLPSSFSSSDSSSGSAPGFPAPVPALPVPLDARAERPAGIDLGVEVFHASLLAQGAEALHVDWRPPAGGDERLAAILARLKGD